MYEVFDHTADLGLRIEADDLPSLFAEAGRALLAATVVDVDSVRPAESVEVQLEADRLDDLLRDWLAELLYRFQAEKMLFVDFDVVLNGARLKAAARGEPIDPDRHEIEGELKAVTYHGLKVERRDDGTWQAEVIVDT